MKAISRKGGGGPSGPLTGSAFFAAKAKSALIADLERDLSESPQRPLLKRKEADAVAVDAGDRLELLDEEEEETPVAAERPAPQRGLVLLSDDDEEEERVRAHVVGSEEEEGGKEAEPPALDDTEAVKARKRKKKEQRDIARTNQQLMIQTALLGANAEIPKKVPKKVDEFALALRLKERLQHVVGRFVPDSGQAEDDAAANSRRLFLTADIEAAAKAAVRRPGDSGDDDDDLVVVAEEPKMKLEPPRPKPTFRNTGKLDDIFGADGQEQHVGQLAFDSTRVWVSQLPAFAGVDIWATDVVLVPRAPAPQAAAEAASDASDGDYLDDELDDVDIADEDDDDLAEAPVSSKAKIEEEEEEEDDASSQESPSSSSSEEMDPRQLRPGLALALGDSLETSAPGFSLGASMSLADDQGIGHVLKKSLASQQVQRSQQPQQQQQQQQQQQVLDVLLTPKKQRAPLVLLDDDLFDDEGGDSKGVADAAAAAVSSSKSQPPPVPLAKRSLSLVFDNVEERIGEGATMTAGTAPLSPASVEAQPAKPSLSLEFDEIGDEGPVAVASVPASATVPLSQPSAEVQPAAPTGGLVLDPVERAKKAAVAKLGLDRFVVRGDAARKMLQEKDKVTAPVHQKKEQPAAPAPVEEDDVFDEERGTKRELDEEEEEEENDGDDESGESRKRSKVEDFVEGEAAVASDANEDEDLFSAEGGEEASQGGEEPEEEEEHEAEAEEMDAAQREAAEQEREDMEALNRLRMEKDLAELNRIKDLYVLGHWKTEKLLQRKQLGMEDYVDDEFLPAWNSIYNRDAVRARLQQARAAPGGEAGAAAEGAGGEMAEGELRPEAASAAGDESSDNEEEYERKREKLRQSLQLAKITALFAGGAVDGPEASMPGGGGESGLGVVSLDGVLGGGDGSRVAGLIENRREVSFSGAGSFAGNLLMREKTADVDPMERFTMRRSGSTLKLAAQERRGVGGVWGAGGPINVGGRQFFEASAEGSNSRPPAAAPTAAAMGPSPAKKHKSTTPKRHVPRSPSVLARKKK